MPPSFAHVVATRAFPLALATLVAACGRGPRTTDRSATAALVIATPADADQLIPPLVTTTQGKQAVDLLFDYLATPDDTVRTVGDAGFRPQLARRWTWAPDSLSIAFDLDPRARWHDGRPVRANDVRFSYALFTDTTGASVHASDFAGIDSVTVRDSLTAVAWWHRRSPEQFFQIAYGLAVMPEHLLGTVPRAALATSAFAAHPVGSGRYRFASWKHQQQLTFAADSANYRGRPHFDRVTWSITGDPATALATVLSGQADLLETVRGEAYAKAQASPRLRTVEYGSLDYAYLAFNERARGHHHGSALFADRAARVAFAQAIDRAALVQNVLGPLGRVALGPFTRAQSTADTALRQIEYDTVAAGRALDGIGWRVDPARHVRVRDGQPISVSLLVPAASAPRMRLAVLLQAQLARLGVHLDVDAADPATFTRRMQAGEFDLALNMWHTDPSPTALRHDWGTADGADIGANVGRWTNPVFNARLDSAATEFDAGRRTALVRRAYATIVDDAAAVWLYEPRNVAAIRRDLRPVSMRADAWWAGLADWGTTAAPTSTSRPAVAAR